MALALAMSGCVTDFLAGPHRGGSVNLPPPPPAQRLQIDPSSASLASLGDSTQFQASWWNDGDLTPATGCTWSVTDGSVATAAGGGAVIATGNGKTIIQATCGDTTATAALGVWQAVASLRLTPGQLDMHLGESAPVRATARDARGNYLARPVDFAWTTSNILVASVQQDAEDPSRALVTRNFPGSAQIRAVAEGAVAAASVR